MRQIVSVLILLATSAPALAVKVLSTQNERVQLDLEGESASPGDKWLVRNSEGKAKALLIIQQVADGKATAQISKGKMPDKPTVVRAAPGKAGGKKSVLQSLPKSGGVLLGYAKNSMTLKPGNSTDITMNGSSFSISGFYRLRFSDKWSSQFIAGYETFSATGTSPASACDGGSSCQVSLGYLGLEALMRYSYVRNPTWEAWAGGGLGFLFAVSKSSNVVNTSKLSANAPVIGSLGFEWHRNSRNSVPVQIDYYLYPNTDTATASQMILRLGYGFNF